MCEQAVSEQAGHGGQVADAELTLQQRHDQPNPAGIGQHAERFGQALTRPLIRQPLADRGDALGIDARDLATIERHDRGSTRCLHNYEGIAGWRAHATAHPAEA